MARPREFDESSAIRQAVNVFWSKGFADTSIADLEEALGMGRQSIYNTFGGKRALFLKALQYYYEQGQASIATAFASANRGLDSIKAYFDGLIVFLTGDDDRRGCFLTRCLVDHGIVDTEVANKCTTNTAHLEALFDDALGEAMADGVLPAGFDRTVAAQLLSTQVYGLSVLARSGATAETMRASVTFLLDQFVET